jgi:predicted PurR-regulated permease PerM
VHQRLSRIVPRAAAAAITVVGTLLVILGLLTLVGTQISGGMSDMANQVSEGIQQVRTYIRNTLGISDDQLGDYVDQARQWLANANLGSRLSSAGVTAGHFVAGIFIALFSLFFFLFDGPRIWAYLVRLFPRSARPYVDSSGAVAWEQLTHYVRATILVAAVDAVGITAGALILRVPFAIAIGVLVFLLSFIPIVGALLSGAVAVLIALVAQGPVTALIMLAVVVAVQQLESHVLQPFILGRSVRIHPVAVIAAIACGAIVAGIVGTLVAVPILAVTKAVANHLFDEYNRHEGITDEPDVGPAPVHAGVSDAPAAQNQDGGRDGRVAHPEGQATLRRIPRTRKDLGLRTADVDQPADAVLVGELTELVAPHLLLEGSGDVGAVRKALPVAAERIAVVAAEAHGDVGFVGPAAHEGGGVGRHDREAGVGLELAVHDQVAVGSLSAVLLEPTDDHVAAKDALVELEGLGGVVAELQVRV